MVSPTPLARTLLAGSGDTCVRHFLGCRQSSCVRLAPLGAFTAGRSEMEDVQGRGDARGIAIKRAGVNQLTYPITVLDRAHERQQTIAKVSMSVGLPHEFKGTHMSRFIEVLEEHRGEVTFRTLPAILHALRDRLQAE